MQRIALTSIRDLMTATRSISNDQRFWARITDGREEIQFSHRA